MSPSCAVNCRKRFPELQFFFQPADIVDQVLNFGQPAPIDIRVSGPNSDEAYALAAKIARDLQTVPGVVDSHVFQVPDAPALTVDVDRTLAQELGLDQGRRRKNVLVDTNSSAQTAPNFWIDPRNGVSYPLVVQMPTYQVRLDAGLWTMPVTAEVGVEAGPAADEYRQVRARQRADGRCRSSTSGRSSTSMPMCRAATSPPPRTPSTRCIAADRPDAVQGRSR